MIAGLKMNVEMREKETIARTVAITRVHIRDKQRARILEMVRNFE